MQLNKIILIGIILMYVPSTFAWNEESGYAEGEEVGMEFVEGYNYWRYPTPEVTNWYDPLIKILIQIKMYLFTEEEIEVTVTTTCMEWDGDSYEESDDRSMFSDTLTNNPNNTVVHVVSLDPVEEFFRNNTDVVDDFITRDDDPEHPDILNVTLNITGAGLDVHESGYTTLNDAALDSIDDTINSPDYGFVSSGRGSDAGSGGIYTGINVYSGEGNSNAQAMGDGFKQLYYIGIPILFVICAFRFIGKLVKKND